MDNWLETKNLQVHFVSAAGVVFREGKVLMIRSERRGWEFPGGVVEQGEAILDGLKDKADRSAQFVCCVCFLDENGEQHLFTGVWNGTIAEAEEGTNGFGYDPIFMAEDSGGRTTASLPITFKETHSHRAKAVGQLMDYLRSL